MKHSSSFFMQSFHATAENHPLWKHEFLTRCRSGNISLQEVKVLAVQMYKFSKEFNRILAGILSCCEDDSAQLVILENLFDEMGHGNTTQAHPELFRRFTRALDIDDHTLAGLPATSETSAMIDTYLKLPHQYGYLAALGVICFASEGIVRSLYTQLYKGISDISLLPKDSLVFFEVHIDVDDSHAGKLATLIEPRLISNEVAIEINQAIIEAMDARVQFFNGIENQISKPNYLDNSLLLINV